MSRWSISRNFISGGTAVTSVPSNRAEKPIRLPLQAGLPSPRIQAGRGHDAGRPLAGECAWISL